MSREAMQMALEALESDNPDIQLRAAIALRQALEEKQDPVAWTPQVWRQFRPDGTFEFQKIRRTSNGEWEDYTAPQLRQWQGLTDEEIWKCNKAKSGSAVEFHICCAHQNVLDFAEAIEAKLREKNKW